MISIQEPNNDGTGFSWINFCFCQSLLKGTKFQYSNNRISAIWVARNLKFGYVDKFDVLFHMKSFSLSLEQVYFLFPVTLKVIVSSGLYKLTLIFYFHLFYQKYVWNVNINQLLTRAPPRGALYARRLSLFSFSFKSCSQIDDSHEMYWVIQSPPLNWDSSGERKLSRLSDVLIKQCQYLPTSDT